MAIFKCTMGITDLEAKVAQIVDSHFVADDRIVSESNFLSWVKENEIKLLCWWDYIETKSKSQLILVPFAYMRGLSHEHPFKVSLLYLAMTQEMALTIAALGFIPVE
jgi:hypothetical protein